MPTLDDFEDNDLAEWSNVASFMGTASSDPYEGSYYAKGNTGSTSTRTCAVRDFPNEIKTVTLYYKEQVDSTGGGYELLDSNNNRVCGWGSSNPEFIWTDNETGKSYNTDVNYGSWVKTTVEIDYQNNNYTVSFNDTTQSLYHEETASVDDTTSATRIRFVNIGDETNLAGGTTGNNGTAKYRHSTDNITYSLRLQAPTNVSASVSSNDVSLSWNAASGASGYNILRAPSSGGSFSQIDSVGSETTSYIDTGLAYAEDYAYKIESFN